MDEETEAVPHVKNQAAPIRYAVHRARDGEAPLYLVMDVTGGRPRPVIALSAEAPGGEAQTQALVEELTELDTQIETLRDQRRAILSRYADLPGSRRPQPPAIARPGNLDGKMAQLVRRQMAGLTLLEAMQLLDVQGWSWKLTSICRSDGEVSYQATVFRVDVGCSGRKMIAQQPVSALTEAWASAQQFFHSKAWRQRVGGNWEGGGRDG